MNLWKLISHFLMIKNIWWKLCGKLHDLQKHETPKKIEVRAWLWWAVFLLIAWNCWGSRTYYVTIITTQVCATLNWCTLKLYSNEIQSPRCILAFLMVHSLLVIWFIHTQHALSPSPPPPNYVNTVSHTCLYLPCNHVDRELQF